MNPETVLQNSLKPVYLEIVNFKNISKKVVDIGGRSFLVMGPNKIGKSSLIQAIMGPMDKRKLPSIAVKEGEDAGRITLKLKGTLNGAEEEYTIDCFFSKKDQSGRLKLTNSKGEELKSPGAKIKDIIGATSFDVMEFYHDKKPDKIKKLKRLTGKEVEIDLIEMEISNMKKQRTTKSDRAADLEGALGNHGYTQEQIGQYSVPVTLEPIQQEYDITTKNQGIWDNVNNGLQQLYNEVNSRQQSIQQGYDEKARIEVQIKALQDRMTAIDVTNLDHSNKITEVQNRIGQGEQWKQQNPRPTMDAVNIRMQAATTHNQHYMRIQQLSTQQNEMLDLKKEVDRLKLDIDKKEVDRDNIIQNSQLPVQGMRFTNEEIYINGLPLEEGQQNTQTMIDIAVDVAIALNPNLKVIFLHEANLFDKLHLEAVVKRIESRGYMVIAEFVKWEGGDDTEVIFTEQIFK